MRQPAYPVAKSLRQCAQANLNDARDKMWGYTVWKKDYKEG